MQERAKDFFKKTTYFHFVSFLIFFLSFQNLLLKFWSSKAFGDLSTHDEGEVLPSQLWLAGSPPLPFTSGKEGPICKFSHKDNMREPKKCTEHQSS